jgi:hypothetical protein
MPGLRRKRVRDPDLKRPRNHRVVRRLKEALLTLLAALVAFALLWLAAGRIG